MGVILIILSSFGFSEKSVFPGINSLAPCLGAALILITGGKLILFKKLFINNVLIFLGKISYSLYLVHWPLYIFYKYIKLEPLEVIEKILLIFITIAISIFIYKFIESPFRKKNNNIFIISTKKMIIILILTLTSIILLSNYLVSTNKFSHLSKTKQTVIKKLKDEEKLIRSFENEVINRIKNKNYFKDSDKPVKVLIWGDSHGGDLYGSLKVNDEFSDLDLEHLKDDFFNCFSKKSYYENYIQIIKDNFLNSKKSCENKAEYYEFKHEILSQADVIILSSRWSKKLEVEKIIKFIRNYSSNQIIVVGRKPHFFHIPTLYIKSKIDLNYLAYLNRNKKVVEINNIIKKISIKNEFIFYDIDSLICSNEECKVIKKNNLLMIDEDHWSYQGFIFYGKMLFSNNFLDIILKNNN